MSWGSAYAIPSASMLGRFGAVLALCGVLGTGLQPHRAHAQQSTTSAQDAPAYKLFRFDEDYRYLQDPTRRADIWDPIKYIPVGDDPSWYLSFGGEARERFEFYNNPILGLRGQYTDAYVLQRTLLHADFHADDYFRVFVQFGSHLAAWKDTAAPPFLDRADVHQAFVDVRLPLPGGLALDPGLRIGRQEMAFGAQRLVSIRDAPSVRRNFDGLRLGGAVDRVRFDVFATRPVRVQEGSFDNRPDSTQAFWGVYTTTPMSFVPASSIDVYYLGFVDERARFAAGAGEERRQTIGARVFGNAAGWDWDWETLGQFGTFARQDVRAWGFSTDTGYSFDVTDWKVRAGLKANVGSGDSDPRNGRLGTVNALFPKLAYFNQAAILGPSNAMDLQPTLSVKPVQDLTVTLGYDFLWRTTTSDAIYTGIGAPIAGTAERQGKFTGRQVALDLSWRVDRHTEIGFGYVHFDPAQALRRAGGHEVDFIYLMGTYKF